VRALKKYIVFIALGLFVALLGCGGGGGGGGGNGSTDGITTGSTDASPSSTILGRCIDNSSQPVAGAVINFFNSSNVQVGTATSRANGYWDANLGTDAVKCEVDGVSLGNGFYAAFRYNNLIYQVKKNGLGVCRVPLPTIVPGTLTSMPGGSFVHYNSGPPPPPPSGCIP